MDLCRKIRALKKFYDTLKNGIFCEMAILVIFCKNLIC